MQSKILTLTHPNCSNVFTGIIEETGKVKAIRRGSRSLTIEVEASVVLEGTQVGDSIATNGVCLTVTSMSQSAGKGAAGTFSTDVMPETVNRTSLAALKPGSEVNLERALTLQSRLGGHMVSGHVDGTGRIVRREADENSVWLWVECPQTVMKYVIEKGSITIQGVSLTVAKVTPDSFAVSLIPHTQGATTLHAAKVGDVVNLENDIIAKYVERMMQAADDAGKEEKPLADKLAMYRNFMK